jgi:hypothetical protein
MMKRRFEGRSLCAELVRVDWQAAEASGEVAGAVSGERSGVNSRTAEAVLEDISASGACVQVEEFIPPGVAISISTIARLADPVETTRFTGCVSYCVYRDYGYFVGIQFSNETKWSSGDFEPQHLTNLEALMTSNLD